MGLTSLVLIVTVIGLANARQFHFKNNLGQTVWVGILGNGGKPTPANGGFALGAHQSTTITTPDDWAGRFWGRSGCNFNGENGHCATGDCGNRLHCNGAGGVPPATLAEITLRGAGGQDFYDVSLVDGFNLPMTMAPANKGGSGYHCTQAGCSKDINPACPGNLQIRSGNQVVACKSSCVVTNSDRDCCRGSYGNANACKGSQSALYFKGNCPRAYSFAYDDASSTYTCDNTDYNITFG